MGLYSSNRISSISAPEFSQRTDILGDQVVYDESYIESIDKDSSYTNPMEVCIQIRQESHNLFNRLIEADFQTSMDVQMLNESSKEDLKKNNDAKKADIIGTTNKILTGVANSANQAGANTTTKINAMVKSDSDVRSKYIKVINSANLQGFKGIRHFVLPGKEYENTVMQITSLKEYNTVLNSVAKKIKSAKSKDEIDDLFSQFGKQISDIYNKRDADIRTNCSTKSEKLMDRWVPTDNEIKAIVAFSDGARIKTNINAGTKNLYAGINKMLSTAVTIMSSINCNDGEISVYKIDRIGKMCSTFSYLASAMITDFYALSSREFAAYRKALLVLGHYATKRSKKQTVSEAVLFSIGESSDIYVYDYFED